ncbi:MAG: TRAP transporter large permease subunit [Gemmatimonadetes bacterium]|nr:TRAP transporter large permease subunit [Gemmatimonadota bacterium]
MFLGALLFLFSGYPVAFSLGGTALLFALLGTTTGAFDLILLTAMPERIFGTMSNYTLLAVPFFLLMGIVLEKSRLAEQLLETIGILFGGLRGGLAIGVVLVGTLLAAATGVVGASVTAMGLISLPVMLSNHYRADFSLGVISASGTLGQIIPPSLVLIVLGDQMGVSVGALFQAALVPGLALAGAYVIYVVVVAYLRPTVAPALPPEARTFSGRALARRVLISLVPPLTLILVVLGSIFAGVATPTEAGALGAVGALILAALNRQLSLANVKAAMEDTTRLTIMVIFLLMGSTAFALVFRGLEGDLWIRDSLANLPGGAVGFLLVVNLAVFLLGCFLDFFEIAFIIVPLLVPAAEVLGIPLLWLGIVLGINLQTSFLTPPFGVSLFYLRGVTPSPIPTTALYRGIMPFVAIQLVVLGAFIALGWR